MRASLLLLALAAWTLFAADGTGEGRRGNARYRAGDYAAAAEAYQAGLDALGPDAPAALTSALWNNLGLARHRQGQPQQAADAFAQALAAASDAEGRARAAYNAGNAAAQSKQLRAALGFYEKALLADPAHDDARYNYEYVKRQLEKQEKKKKPKPSDPPPDIDPSDFAKRLKRQADSLVAQQRYRAAFNLMTGGLRQDSTVRAFQPFIQRTGTVADIDAPADSAARPRRAPGAGASVGT